MAASAIKAECIKVLSEIQSKDSSVKNIHQREAGVIIQAIIEIINFDSLNINLGCIKSDNGETLNKLIDCTILPASLQQSCSLDIPTFPGLLNRTINRPNIIVSRMLYDFLNFRIAQKERFIKPINNQILDELLTQAVSLHTRLVECKRRFIIKHQITLADYQRKLKRSFRLFSIYPTAIDQWVWGEFDRLVKDDIKCRMIIMFFLYHGARVNENQGDIVKQLQDATLKRYSGLGLTSLGRIVKIGELSNKIIADVLSLINTVTPIDFMQKVVLIKTCINETILVDLIKNLELKGSPVALLTCGLLLDGRIDNEVDTEIQRDWDKYMEKRTQDAISFYLKAAEHPKTKPFADTVLAEIKVISDTLSVLTRLSRLAIPPLSLSSGLSEFWKKNCQEGNSLQYKLYPSIVTTKQIELADNSAPALQG